MHWYSRRHSRGFRSGIGAAPASRRGGLGGADELRARPTRARDPVVLVDNTRRTCGRERAFVFRDPQFLTVVVEAKLVLERL